MTSGDLSEVAAAPRRGSLLPVTLVIAAVVVLVDQVTKHWAVNALAGGDARHVVWTLQWNLAFNSGMAFSRGRSMGPIIGVVALLVAGFIVMAARGNASRLAAVAAGLVLGGAVGNVCDRAFRGDGWLRGSVIDFIDFQWFPIFNVADICVNVGGALFILWSFFSGRKQASPA
jgi:signal peptidase II